MGVTPSGQDSLFRTISSHTGAIHLRWQPVDETVELHAWLLLRDPRTLTPSDLHPSTLLRDLIRIPLAPSALETTFYVPIERPLGLALVARSPSQTTPLTPPPFEVAEAPMQVKAARPAPQPTPESTAPSLASPPEALKPAPLQALVRGEAQNRTYTSPLRETPLIFAKPTSTTKASVAQATTPIETALRVDPRFASLAKRLSNSFELPNQAPVVRPQGFGLKQRWTLSRFLLPLPALGARFLLCRSTFISADMLEAALHSLPEDARPLPEGCDGLIDAHTPDEQTAFYAVLEARPEGFVPLTLTLDNPPFTQARHLVSLGDALTRLTQLEAPAQPSVHYQDLLAQAKASAARALILD